MPVRSQRAVYRETVVWGNAKNVAGEVPRYGESGVKPLAQFDKKGCGRNKENYARGTGFKEVVDETHPRMHTHDARG